MRVRLLPPVLLATSGCIQEPSVPKVGLDPVSISLTVSTQTLRPGIPDTIRVTVQNNLEQPVRISFDNLCQVFVTIRNQAGDVVTPRNGRPQCLPVQSQLTLVSLGRQVFTTVWTGGFDFAPPDTQAKVPPGAYFVSAELRALGYSTLAPAFKVDVIP
ncbi:MAG: hypothetical protein ACT4P7_03300 [Gemmatimonadaceae bacterium]